MELAWLEAETVSDRDIAGALGVIEAARALDYPHRLSHTTTTYTALVRHGWHGDPPTVALARDTRGRVNGVLELSLPRWDNAHLAGVNIVVDPVARRRGLGHRLFQAALERIRAQGRTLVVASCFDTPAAVGFLKAIGMDEASEDVYRSQDVRGADWDRLDTLCAHAAEHARDYELIRIPGPTPDELMADIAYLTGAINDAPVGELDVEDSVFPPERIREFEASQTAHGRRYYRLIARHRETGAIAGHTVVGVDKERPWYAWQYDTSVLRTHRGHRLGLYLKIEMMRWLVECEPQLRTLLTANATSNTHMTRVNDLLHYRVVARLMSWQRHLDPGVPSST